MMNRLPPDYRVQEPVLAPAAASIERDAESHLVERLFDRAAACVGAYPAASLAAAFVVGLALGRLAKSL